MTSSGTSVEGADIG